MAEHLPRAVDGDEDRVTGFGRYELEGSIVRRFEAIARLNPSRVALGGDGKEWTYEALDRHANRIARAIRDHTSVGRGCVAMLVGHSPSMVIGALAALKAGKAFLCIHPGTPPLAQREIISDALPDVLLTDATHDSDARNLAGPNWPVIRLDGVGRACSADPLDLPIAPEDPAAIFYTSGSTGRPKGIVKSHRTVLHRAWLCAEYDFIGPADRQSLMTYCSFASSEADVFGALLNGARLELYNAASRGLADMGAWIDERGITLLHPPVVLFRRYLSTLAGSGLHPTVRLVALAGETVAPSDLQKWRQHFSQACALRHRFSSTEAGHIAVGSVAAGEAIAPGTVPAPRPVSDKVLSVVDDLGRTVEEGEVGELLVHSAFLADGAWRRDATTADGFSADPRTPGQRLFRTGDLGRILPDGSLEFLGRRDNQVKIRGYRVETHEIEAALLALPEVSEAAVIAEQDEGEYTLIAFVAAGQGASVQPEALRSALRSVLPLWKIPARIQIIESLPLTPTGKVDRQILKQHLQTVPHNATAAVDPDPRIAKLTAIWEELLRRSGVRPEDDFFDLGGHSLLAAQLVIRVNEAFGRSLPLTTLLSASTIRQQADILAQPVPAAAESRQEPVAILRPGGARIPLFCLPPASGSMFQCLQLTRLLDTDQPVYALRYDDDGAGEPDASFRRMAERCVRHIKLARPQGPYRLCGHSFGGGLAYEVARQLQEAGDAVDLLAIFDTRAPRPPKSLPPYRRLPLYLSQLASRGRRDAMRYLGRRLSHRLRQRYRLRLLLQRLRLAGSPPAELSRRYLSRNHRPMPYSGTITLFRATKEPKWNEPALISQPVNGWDRWCKNIEVHAVPGDHLTIMEGPNLEVLAGILTECLRGRGA